MAQAKKGTGERLYSAMRRYGAAAFEIALIRADAKNFRELQDQAVAAIKERRTRINGYNLAKGGSIGTAKSFVIGNREFASWGEAAQHFGIEPGTFAARISKRGWTPEQAAGIEPREKFVLHRVTVSGVSYRSLKAAAESRGLLYHLVYERHILRGWTLEQALEIATPPVTARRRGIKATVFGKEFPSLSACAIHFGISATTLQAKVSSGKFSAEDAVRHLQRRAKPGVKRRKPTDSAQ